MMPKLFIGICNSQKDVPASFFWSFINIQNPCPSVAMRSGHPWDVVRNNAIIDAFLKSTFDVLVKMDIDQEYPSDYFTTMVPLVEQYGVVGPLIFDRWQQSGYMPLAFEKYGNPHVLNDGWKKWDIRGKTGVHEIPYTHTNNFYAREALEKIPAPWYEAKLSADGLSRANHVDYNVLDKIKAAGFPIYCNLDVCVKHEGVGRKEWETAQHVMGWDEVCAHKKGKA
jgi:hypothetical protein